MKLKKINPHSYSWMYIQPHKLQTRLFRTNGRNLRKGDCGFFVSTEIWIKSISPVFSNTICNSSLTSRVIFIFKSCGFLFVQNRDKPHPLYVSPIHSNPKSYCRSPPPPSDFTSFQKIEWRRSKCKTDQELLCRKVFQRNFSYMQSACI